MQIVFFVEAYAAFDKRFIFLFDTCGYIFILVLNIDKSYQLNHLCEYYQRFVKFVCSSL